MTIKNIEGRTYSLPENGEYYIYIREQVNRLSAILGGLDFLDKILSELIARESQPVKKYEKFEEIFAPISSHLLDTYTPKLRSPSLYLELSQKSKEDIFNISVRGYHLRMLHIEVLNQVMENAFMQASHKVIILPHCLRDFRSDKCQFKPGEVDYFCSGCTTECQINQTRILLRNYPNYHLYISQNQDLEMVFNKARQLYKDIGLIGVACIPELYEGMILSRKMKIPAQGIPLNYNRCRRWMEKAHYTNFNLGQLQRLVR